MRPPRIDPDTVEVQEGQEGHWIFTWDVALPDPEWLLAFWSSMAEGRKLVIKASSEGEARRAFSEMMATAQENWARIAQNRPDGP